MPTSAEVMERHRLAELDRNIATARTRITWYVTSALEGPLNWHAQDRLNYWTHFLRQWEAERG